MTLTPVGGNHAGLACSLQAIRFALILFVSLASAWSMAAGQVGRTEDPGTGLVSWRWSAQGVSIELTQLLPDQTRAFFLGRGFPRAEADRIALTCVFQSIFRNDGESVVAYDLNDWTVLYRDERLSLRTREVWEPEWTTAGVGKASRIAFRWSLLPTLQRFEPGDYNWGMISLGPPPGERLDLSLRVRLGDQVMEGTVRGVLCAPDR